ncbi:M20/M25/M40 family metallo-hydrolase [Nocardia sp. NPDC050175]|uniref:M20/M25/M40 family metallo-hydrolase n=1 Tax=Nocardia sp. NPDC050175 TaxID=3364317 RepID=UPI003794A24E
MTPLHISSRRFLLDLAELATFGRRQDGGIDRVAGSAADLASRAWIRERIEACGLSSWADDTGNVFGRRGNSRGPWLLVGSHTDTVPGGGYLDGAYGVIAALEVLRVLHEADHPAADMLEIVSFWDEEGAQANSTGGLVGSTALCAGGHIESVAGYLELHIEQGPRMEAAELELAAVSGIVGVARYSVTMQGVANHGGTTPMLGRADAGQAAVKAAAQIIDLVTALDPGMVANLGFIEFEPGAPNVIPGRAEFVVEFRAGTEQALRTVRRQLEQLVQHSAEAENCSGTVEQISYKPVARFDPALCHTVEMSLRTVAPAVGRLLSYAGHDASVLSRYVPTAMVFVPSTGGISHAPDEYTPEPLLVQGAQALLQCVLAVHASASSPRGAELVPQTTPGVHS